MKYNTPKSMGCGNSATKREIYSNNGPTSRNKKKLKQSNFIPK